MNPTKLAAEYDRLYAEAEKVLDEFKPCEHRTVKRQHRCLGHQDAIQSGIMGAYNPQCCCYDCKFWKNGCSAEKPLACKTWLCGIARLRYPEAAEQLSAIARQAIDLGIYYPRSDKPTSLLYAKLDSNP